MLNLNQFKRSIQLLILFLQLISCTSQNMVRPELQQSCSNLVKIYNNDLQDQLEDEILQLKNLPILSDTHLNLLTLKASNITGVFPNVEIALRIFACKAITNCSANSEEPFAYYSANGLYQQSVTLTARMWPQNDERSSSRVIFGLPSTVLAVSLSVLLLALLIVLITSFRYWLSPRKDVPVSISTTTQDPTIETMSNRTMTANKNRRESCCIVIPMPIAPPKYSAPPAPPNEVMYGFKKVNIADDRVKRSMPETHKSMWAVNSKYIADPVAASESETALKSRSLPSWGRSKQRPISNPEHFEELYIKVNANKKPRNRMGNDEAAIIALCRSRSQNLTRHHLEREGVVIYDERTSL